MCRHPSASILVRAVRVVAGLLAVVLSPIVTATDLEPLRASANLAAQRAHAWQLLARITQPDDSGAPAFEAWHGEDEVFGAADDAAQGQGIRGFSRLTSGSSPSSAGAPVLTYTLYNSAAQAHIRRQQLHSRDGLQRMKRSGITSIPEFPEDSLVLKTAWWPVAKRGVTVLPVWDPHDNPARRDGNPWSTWKRVVAISAEGASKPDEKRRVEFLGREYRAANLTSVAAFHQVVVTRAMARRIAQDGDAAKVAQIALGRPIAEGDHLVLVGANLASRELRDWVWAALWWHDRAGEGEFAAQRPASVSGVWRNLLMQVAFDPVLPRTSDGAPHVCFNPWLEARFPDAGQGGGTSSNCMACHGRASIPAADFLPVTRGAARSDDPAWAGDRLRTSLLWSIARRGGAP